MTFRTRDADLDATSTQASSDDSSGLGWLNWAAGPLAVLVVGLFGIGVPAAVVSLAPSSVVKQPKAPQPPLDMASVAAGHRLYAVSCVACHGADAHGVAGLGRDLTKGFARSASDPALVRMIIRGRQPGEPGHTAAVPMPPKGGRPDFGDSDIANIVSYLRSLQDPTRVTGPEPEVVVAVLDAADPEPAAAAGEAKPAAVASATPSAAGPTPAPSAAPSAAASPTPTPAAAANAGASPAAGAAAFTFDPAAATRGKKVFMNCIACHGKDGTGLPKLGADLAHSEFVATNSDEALVAFITKGRLASDPESKLKLNMPAKGGNPALKENQIKDVVAYVRSLQANAQQSEFP